MEKLWLSGTEKKFYAKVYAKLVESANKTQAKDLKKLTITRAGIDGDAAAIIIQKSFDLSNDKKYIDSTGFFYLMKYIAYLQNGGDPNDDITKIQKELPKPNLPSGSRDNKNSSNSLLQSSNSNEESLGNLLQSSNGGNSLGNAEEKNQVEESKEMHEEQPQQKKEGGEGQKIVESKKEEEQKGMDKITQILMTSDGYYIEGGCNNSDIRNDDVSLIRGEASQDAKTTEISGEKASINVENKAINQEGADAEEKKNENDQQIEQPNNFLQESEKFSMGDSEIYDLQQSAFPTAINEADEEDGKEDAKEKEQDQSKNPASDEQMIQINLDDDFEKEQEQKQKSVHQFQINPRMLTFGANIGDTYAFQQMVQVINHEVQYPDDRNQQTYDNEGVFRNERSFTFAGGPVEQIGMTPDGASQIRKQNSLRMVEELNEENSKIRSGNGSNVRDEVQEKENQALWGGVSKLGLDGISQLSFGEDGQSQFLDFRNSGETNNTNTSKIVFGKQEESRLYYPNEEQHQPIMSKQVEYALGNHVKNGFNASVLNDRNEVDQEEHETQNNKQKYPVLPQRNLSNNNKTNGLNGNNNQQQLVQAQNNYDEDDNEEGQLMKSVMDCNEFSKTDQNQIKIALDMLKLNRDGSQLQKSLFCKEKTQKRVKIEGWREACDNLFMKKHVLYEIHTQSDKGQLFTVDRRYNHFKALHNYFENSAEYFGIIKPQLPSQNKTNIGSYLGSTLMDQTTLEQRKIDLENYLNLYLSNEILGQDKILSQFLEAKEFIAPEEKPFSYLDWMKNLAANAINTDFAELKEYVEAVLKTNMQEFFKQSESEIDTRDIDEKMEQVKSLGMQVSRLVDFLSEDIRFDTEQRLSIDQLEVKYYTEADQREDQMAQQENKSGIQESLKKFKAELIDLKDQIKQSIDSKVQVLQQFRFIHSLIESAKVAQQVLKRKITDRIILKKIKISKVNKLHEQNSSNTDASEAQRKLKTVSDQFQKSEEIINSIQKILTKELGTFIKIQQNNIAEGLTAFIAMQKKSLMIFAKIDASKLQLLL